MTSSLRRSWLVALFASHLCACAGASRLPFTPEDQAFAQVPGIPNARFWSDDARAIRAILLHPRGTPPAVLALSGGGAEGAFGAGVLIGWSETGSRPEFSLVSGVSAGALIAPFAFLGTEYDLVLQEVLTGGHASELVQLSNFADIFSSGALNTTQLRRLVARFVDEPMLERVAEKHRRGNRLIIVTTNLDAQRSVVWNLGAVAASNHPARLQIFREVLVASASVPGMFSPVLIDVEANGRRFAEMHVDGGVTYNVFVAPDPVLAAPNLLPAKLRGRIFVVVNNKIAPDFEVVENQTLPVVVRSLSTMVKTDTNRILLSTYRFARTHGLEFNLAAIDPAYPTSTTINFDREYMLGLFRHGLERARAGQIWQRSIIPTGPTPKPRLEGIETSQRHHTGSAGSVLH
jgi:predicted acylesterase/phospholipase RssA